MWALTASRGQLIRGELPEVGVWREEDVGVMQRTALLDSLRKLPPKEFEGVLHPGESLLSFFMGALLLRVYIG